MKSSKLYLIGLAVITVTAAVIISCEKDEDSKPPVGITNRIDIKADSIKNILYRDAKAYGSVGDYKNITFSQYGHCWDTLETPTIDNNKTEFQNLTAKSVFTSNLTSLKPDKTYYIRSYAKTNSITIYSEIVNFQTRALEAPVVTTDSTTQIASTSVNIWGAIALDGGTDISAKGVCWGITENPTLQNQHAEFTGAQDTFKVPVAGLEKYTTYYARIYAVNQTGTGYGNNVTFKTLAEQPLLTTTEVTSITAYTATGGGSITSNGGAEITTRGICWGLDPNPTTSNNQCVASVGADTYSCNLTSLQPGKAYHVRAFATNIAGTSYGNDVTFTTPPVLPTVTTTQITDVTANSATTGGNVTYDGGATVTARGVCWSTSENPTITDPHTTNSDGIGTYSSSITGIAFATKYYVRAYATNIAGTSYGEQLSFITSAVQPTVATNSISSITGTSAIVSSEVLTDGGASITERGICWSINENPTLNENKVTGGSGVGVYQCSITGLANGTTYHVRAYAINSIGTVYGTDKTFTTHSLPTVTTSDITGITTSSAQSGGNIVSDGGTSVTARGVCWSTSQNPTLSNNFTNDGVGAGSFNSDITGLSSNTTYYLRAYATNSVGTSFGNQLFFTTNAIPDGPGNTITDVEGNTYNTVWIGGKQWMTENLRATKYNDGSSIPIVEENSVWVNMTTPAYCWYDNNQIANSDTYGALYNWYSVNTGKLCPNGWSVPSEIEWTTLTNYVSGSSIIDYGFSPLMSGLRNSSDGLFRDLNNFGLLWSMSEFDNLNAWYRQFYIDGNVSKNNYYKKSGFSVRCVKSQ